MDCPICKEKMKLVGKDASQDFRNGKKYDREVYHCEKDDIWINIEKPIKEEIA